MTAPIIKITAITKVESVLFVPPIKFSGLTAAAITLERFRSTVLPDLACGFADSVPIELYMPTARTFPASITTFVKNRLKFIMALLILRKIQPW